MGTRAQHGPTRAIAYLRVSTTEQADSGAGLDAQRYAVTAEADRRGWDLTIVEDAGYSAKDLNRPALTDALAKLDAHEYEALLVSKVDRLSRSVHDFTGILAHASKHSWAVVCLDLGVDTSTPSGELLANLVASTAQYERRLIGQRTRDALAARRAAGVRLGGPQLLPDAVIERIVRARNAGESLPKIAAQLEADGVRTGRGGTRWYPSTIKAVCESQAAQQFAS